MYVGLDESGIRAASPGAPQHSVRQVNGDYSGRRGTLAQAGNERSGSRADLQDCLRRAQYVLEGRQQSTQHLMAAGGLLFVPSSGQILEKSSQAVHNAGPFTNLS